MIRISDDRAIITGECGEFLFLYPKELTIIK
jgi:hypothetical protein